MKRKVEEEKAFNPLERLQEIAGDEMVIGMTPKIWIETVDEVRRRRRQEKEVQLGLKRRRARTESRVPKHRELKIGSLKQLRRFVNTRSHELFQLLRLSSELVPPIQSFDAADLREDHYYFTFSWLQARELLPNTIDDGQREYVNQVKFRFNTSTNSVTVGAQLYLTSQRRSGSSPGSYHSWQMQRAMPRVLAPIEIECPLEYFCDRLGQILVHEVPV